MQAFPQPGPNNRIPLAAQFQSQETKGSCLCVYQEMGGKNHHSYQEPPGLEPLKDLGWEKKATQILPKQ